MKTQQINARQKKFLLMLPIIVLPFVVLLFWSLGGGGANAQNVHKTNGGINAKLPGASLKSDSSASKMSFYAQAEKDSIKAVQDRKDDPYYQSVVSDDTTKRPGTGPISLTPVPDGGLLINNSTSHLHQSEQDASKKLAELKTQIAQSSEKPASANGNSDSNLAHFQEAVSKLNNSTAPDPQMEQLSNMLDKISDIQNPGLARQRMKAESEKHRGKVFTVTTHQTENTVSSLGGSNAAPGGNGFYALDNGSPADEVQNTIEAVVHQEQTIVNGSTVKMRLANDVFVNGRLIPKNTFVYGLAQLNGDRLEIKVTGINYQKSLFPVSLAVYDLDGISGIYIPGAISRDVAKESADQSMQNFGLTTLDPSLGAQAASAGISAAKTLFSRKVKLVKVVVKAGYKVLLKDEKQQENEQ